MPSPIPTRLVGEEQPSRLLPFCRRKYITMNKKEFRTRDLNLSVFLLSSGVFYVGIEPFMNGVYEFIFENPQKCKELKQEFLSGGKAPAQLLLVNKRFLINQLNQKKDLGDTK